jgi:hypothetical protein
MSCEFCLALFFRPLVGDKFRDHHGSLADLIQCGQQAECFLCEILVANAQQLFGMQSYRDTELMPIFSISFPSDASQHIILRFWLQTKDTQTANRGQRAELGSFALIPRGGRFQSFVTNRHASVGHHFPLTTDAQIFLVLGIPLETSPLVHMDKLSSPGN